MVHKVVDLNFIFFQVSNDRFMTGGIRRYLELYQGFSDHGCHTHLFRLNEVDRLHLLRQIARINGLKVLVLFDESTLPLAMLVKFLFHCKIVFCPRGNKLEHAFHGPLRRFAKRLLFSLLYGQCNLMIFQTYAQIEEFRRVYFIRRKSGIEVVHNSMMAKWIKIASVKPAPNQLLKIGFMGGDQYRKGFDILYAAYQILLKRIENPPALYLCGRFEKDFHGRGIRNWGLLQDANDFLSEVDLLVVPSRYDSFPNVILEAIAAGTGLIASKTKIFKELLCDEVLLFENNPMTLAGRLEELIKSPALLREVHEKSMALRWKYSFNWVDRMLTKIRENLR